MQNVFVPCWGSLFQNSFWKTVKFGFALFSSPTGVLYFKISHFIFIFLLVGVFVPCWGSLFQNLNKELNSIWTKVFSSPAGVLYFKIVVKIGNVEMYESFSSPAGVLYFKIIPINFQKKSGGLVFVPCWGSLFQNAYCKRYMNKDTGFRPLLGFFISK